MEMPLSNFIITYVGRRRVGRCSYFKNYSSELEKNLLRLKKPSTKAGEKV